jgi:endonuclease/exonuclease/phosphatase family metal-dependent hydrolase
MWNDFAYGRNAVYPEGHHGNAVLSRFPIIEYENRDISVPNSEKRGVLHCRLKVPERDIEVHVMCVHLGLRESHRNAQLDLLMQRLAELPDDAPVIVAGDFNDWRQRADAQLKPCGLREVFAEHQGKPARSFPARLPTLRLDRIYVRNAGVHSPVVLPRKPWSHLSDHAPLVAEIAL